MDYGRARRLLAQKFHDPRPAEFVQSRGGLVHDDDIGPLKQHAREAEPLLLAAG
jgi:hypothetical protein